MVHEIDGGPPWPCPARCRAYLKMCGDKDMTCSRCLDSYIVDDPDEPVFVVESGLEQAMLEAANLLAVCAPVVWRPPDVARWTEDFRDRPVTLCPVATTESRSRMRSTGEKLLPVARELRWLELPDLLPKVKRDGSLDQHLDEHHVEALALIARPWPVEVEVDAARLLARPDPPWLIERLLPAGLTVLTGQPEPGLASLALELAVAVAEGIPPVSAGPVLYCALDEPVDRLSARLRRFLAGDPPPVALSIRTDLPALDEGGIAVLRDWAYRHPEGRLIVVDGLDQVQPRRSDLRLDAATLLSRLATELGVAILAVHRSARQGSRHQPAGGMHHCLRLRTEGARRAVLERGAEGRLALTWDGDRERWTAQEQEAVALSASRQAIWELLAAHGPLTPSEIRVALGQAPATTRSLLLRMTRDGQLIPQQGRYRRAGEVAGLLPAPEG